MQFSKTIIYSMLVLGTFGLQNKVSSSKMMQNQETKQRRLKAKDFWGDVEKDATDAWNAAKPLLEHEGEKLAKKAGGDLLHYGEHALENLIRNKEQNDQQKRRNKAKGFWGDAWKAIKPMAEHEGEALAKKAGSDALHYGEKAVESYIRNKEQNDQQKRRNKAKGFWGDVEHDASDAWKAAKPMLEHEGEKLVKKAGGDLLHYGEHALENLIRNKEQKDQQKRRNKAKGFWGNAWKAIKPMAEHEGEALAKKAGNDALHYGEKAVESYIRNKEQNDQQKRRNKAKEFWSDVEHDASDAWKAAKPMLEHAGEKLAQKAGDDLLKYGEKAAESYIRKNKN